MSIKLTAEVGTMRGATDAVEPAWPAVCQLTTRGQTNTREKLHSHQHHPPFWDNTSGSAPTACLLRFVVMLTQEVSLVIFKLWCFHHTNWE